MRAALLVLLVALASRYGHACRYAEGREIVAVALGGTASADTQICEQYGSAVIQGRYVVQNNRWGTTAQQCINVTSTGFSITSQQGSILFMVASGKCWRSAAR